MQGVTVVTEFDVYGSSMLPKFNLKYDISL